jgi:hypothetical protein
MLSISCFDMLFADHIEAPRFITHDNSTKKNFFQPLDMRYQAAIVSGHQTKFMAPLILP